MRTTVDADWAATIARKIRASELDIAVVLGFDGVYDQAGDLDPQLSQMIVPPSWVFAVCKRHPELLPGPSINPFRRDALERLDECVEGGAVLLKWLPSTQRIDPSSPRLGEFYRRLAEAGLPLLVHSGGSEVTFAEVDSKLKDVRLLQAPLDAGVTVICAHSGAPSLVSRDRSQLPLLREMLIEHPNLWVDNSGMATPSRFKHLPRLALDSVFQERTLYGSDYPVPSNAIFYPRRLGRQTVVRLERERNLFQRDIGIKRALGYPDSTLTVANRVLPNIERWNGDLGTGNR
ncbi:MAG TPA: amidohydrolase family protein [Longimicrobiaceae bacterium]|nr:amidohydrolase family protein [Longimicrobiaceae bacterium]